jgi:predicted nucleic acid-binding protein
VKIDTALQAVAEMFLDTALVIYFVERNPTYAALVDDIFNRIDSGAVQTVTSPITLMECLVVPIQKSQAKVQQDFTDLIVSGANVRFVGLDSSIAQLAAKLRADHGLKLADAFQAATAVISGCGALLTNDLGLKRVPGISVLVLDELEL